MERIGYIRTDSDQARTNQTRPCQVRPNQTKSEQIKSSDQKVDAIKLSPVLDNLLFADTTLQSPYIVNHSMEFTERHQLSILDWTQLVRFYVGATYKTF